MIIQLVDVSEFRTFIRATRIEKGMSQEGVANAVGMNVTSYAMIERGERVPLLTTAIAICLAMGVKFEIG